MITEIAASIAAAKNVADLLKAAQGSSSPKESKEALAKAYDRLIEMQELLVEANQAAFMHEQTVSNLKQQIVQMQDWKADAERYQLTEIAPGAFAYTVKPGIQTTEPPHSLCANCFSKHQKSILQLTGKIIFFYECHLCNSKISAPGGRR